jgi:hypothetical protein
MYSLLLLLITILQLGAVGVSYLAGEAQLFYNLAVYGSPFYSVMTLFRQSASVFDQHPLYLVMFIYHLTKYFLFYLAQRKEQMNGMLITAVIFEAAYLLVSAYYSN